MGLEAIISSFFGLFITSAPKDRYDAEKVEAKILGEPVELPFSKLVVKSRFLKAAMSERLASWDQEDLAKRGIPSKELIHLYEEWGKGGFGIILTGNTMISPKDIEAPGNPVVYGPFEAEERVSAFQKQAEAAKRHGSVVVMQISHAGRQVAEAINPNPVSASDVQLETKLGMTFGKPTPLTKEGIQEIIEQYAYAAEFAQRTGYNGVELHAAHGYLLAQFLSSTTNKRTDEYGGSLENRARIIYEVIEEIKRRVPDTAFSIGIKINSVEFQDGGFQPEECKQVCVRLEELGVDFIELSGGTYEEFAFAHKKESTRKREAFFIEFADMIRPNLKKTKLYVTGGFKTASGMVRAIKGGSSDGIGLGRPACEEPYFPNLLLSGKVCSARKTLLDENEFGPTTMFGGSQLTQVAHGEKVWNSAKKSDVELFKRRLTEQSARHQELSKKGLLEAGFVH